MSEGKKKNPTWFFLVVIAGALVLLGILLFGKVPHDTNTNEESDTQTEMTNSVDGGEDEVDEEDSEEETAEVGAATIEIEDDVQVDIASTDEIQTQTFESGGQVTRAPEDFEGVMRESLGITEEEDVTVDGREGVKAYGRSAKDGSSVTVIFVVFDGYIYEIQGDDTFLDSVIEGGTFTFN